MTLLYNVDDDDDNDSWSDADESACGSDPLDSASMPSDFDGDLICDVVDSDDDNDGTDDASDAFPFDNTEDTDTAEMALVTIPTQMMTVMESLT